MKNNFWKNKKVLITGCCGTVGGEILNQLIEAKTKKIIAIDNRETEIFEKKLAYKSNKNVNVFIGDISDLDDCLRFTSNIDIVLHTAAFKHVELCELSPNNAVRNNIVGTQNLISASIKNKVKKFIFTSSDKAVNPSNVMGSTKLLAERLVSSANAVEACDTIFASTRFGNILGSRGSVLTIFEKQIRNNLPLAITDLKMTRYVMTLKKACQLVLKSTILARGGEVFIFKMKALKILDLAKAFYKLQKGTLKNFKYKIIGKKNAEKNYEELITSEESLKLEYHGDIFSTDLNRIEKTNKEKFTLNSKYDEHISIDEIINLLKKI
jgi:FlaA1/EpsC-like NDP-sugar epimerase